MCSPVALHDPDFSSMASVPISWVVLSHELGILTQLPQPVHHSCDYRCQGLCLGLCLPCWLSVPPTSDRRETALWHGDWRALDDTSHLSHHTVFDISDHPELLGTILTVHALMHSFLRSGKSSEVREK